MRMKQWADKTYDMSAEIIAKREAEKGKKTAEHVSFDDLKEAYERGEINEAQLKTFGAAAEVEEVLGMPEMTPEMEAELTGKQKKNAGQPPLPPPVNRTQTYIDGKPVEDLIPNIEDQLTKDDKIYLATKWGTLYEPEEWVKLEKLWEEYSQKGSSRPDIVKMICKTSLKMQQAIDQNDYDSYNKLSRTYDQMTKSANFTDLQNKDNKDMFSSIGEIVRLCEREGGKIPPHQIETDFDIIDTVIRDLKEYNKRLIYEDQALADEIELYLKNRELAEEEERQKRAAREEKKKSQNSNDFDLSKTDEGIKKKTMTYDDYLAFALEQEKMEEDDRFALGGGQ